MRWIKDLCIGNKRTSRVRPCVRQWLICVAVCTFGFPNCERVPRKCKTFSRRHAIGPINCDSLSRSGAGRTILAHVSLITHFMTANRTFWLGSVFIGFWTFSFCYKQKYYWFSFKSRHNNKPKQNKNKRTNHNKNQLQAKIKQKTKTNHNKKQL